VGRVEPYCFVYCKQQNSEMSRFVRQSLLRNLVVDPCPIEEHFQDLDVGDVASSGNLVACSPKFVAFVSSHAGANAIGIVDISNPGRCAEFGHAACQRDSVLDLAFSPHGVDNLASGAGDGTVAIWRVNNDKIPAEQCTLGKVENLSKALAVRWHSSVSGLLASVHNDQVAIWDVAQGTRLTSLNDVGKIDACWDGSGKLILSMNSDKSLTLADPRSSAGELGRKDNVHRASRVLGRVIAGSGDLEHFVYTTGFSQQRDREFAVWDLRNLSECLSRQKAGSGSSGILIPVLLPDLRILFMATKGETTLRAFEATTTKPFVHSILQATASAEPMLGLAAIPVPACNYMNCEVGRLAKLIHGKIETIKVEVPRKSKSTFHEELFPETNDFRASGMDSATSWWKLDRAEEVPQQPKAAVQELHGVLYNDKEKREVNESAKTDLEKISALLAENEAEKGEEEDAPQGSAENATLDPSEAEMHFSKQLGYVPKMKYARGLDPKLDDTIFNITPGVQPAIAVGAVNIAVTWAGGGGPVFVTPTDRLGKVQSPADVSLLNLHSKPVFSLAFSPFGGDKVLATGSDDCRIGVSHVNVEALPESTSTLLTGHQGCVRHLAFHPSVENVLSSASQDGTVRLWDISAEKEIRVQMEMEERTCSIAWSFNGNEMAALNRANALRILDPRKPEIVGNIQTHEGAQPGFVTFLGATNYILTSGCSKTGLREFMVWDRRKLDSNVSFASIGSGSNSAEPLYVEENGVVILHARGENAFSIFEIEGLTRAELKPKNMGATPLRSHPCQRFSAKGPPTSAVALAPRRVCDTSKAEWARVFRLTSRSIDPISFTVPRSEEMKGFFADDLYPETRSDVPGLSDVDAWLNGEAVEPVLESMNTSKQKRLSQRDPTQAHAALRRGAANAKRFREEQEAADSLKKEQEDVFAKMQFSAMQHEAYNPNLSKGHSLQAEELARAMGASVDQALEDSNDVEDDEWDD